MQGIQYHWYRDWCSQEIKASSRAVALLLRLAAKIPHGYSHMRAYHDRLRVENVMLTLHRSFKLASFAVVALIAVMAIPPVQAEDFNPFQTPFFGFDPSPPVPESATLGTRITVRPRPYPPKQHRVSFCVRTCDGRYFPLSGRTTNQSLAQTCSDFCPAAQTTVYSGSSIDEAETADGKAYKKSANAFRYRSELVSNCSCTASGASGLTHMSIEDDPTIRKGDIVAQPEGLMVVTSVGRRRSGLVFRPLSKERALAYRIAPPATNRETLIKARAEMERAAPSGPAAETTRTANNSGRQLRD